MVLETERLYLRELNENDFDALCEILTDEKTMYAYEGAFDRHEVREWLDRQLDRYKKWGFGLWAVVLKETGEVIGQCGLTMQPWNETELLESKRRGHALFVIGSKRLHIHFEIPAYKFSYMGTAGGR